MLLNFLYKFKVLDKYGEWWGVVFGLVGVIKGFGFLSIKCYKIMEVLWVGVDDK